MIITVTRIIIARVLAYIFRTQLFLGLHFRTIVYTRYATAYVICPPLTSQPIEINLSKK